MLSTFIKIADTGDRTLLVVKGKANAMQLAYAWEEIVKKNYKANNTFGFDDYLDMLKTYGSLLADYNKVKAALCLLTTMVDSDLIKFLKSKGYNIDVKNHESFARSLSAAWESSENLGTRLQIKYNEISREYKEDVEKRKSTIDEMLAVLSYELGFSVADNITLSKYNEYKRVLKEVSNKVKRLKDGEID